jgi:tetratricopeptide (TPR) repeat protein
MKLFRNLLIFAALAIGATAHADQTDTRLNALFDQLKVATAPREAVVIEQKIWAIWLEVPQENIRVLMDEGLGAMRRNDGQAALKVFDQVVMLAPDFAEGWNKRATVHYLLRNYEESLADIDATVELEPRHFGALSGRGLVFVKLRNLQKALAAFEAALEVHPQSRGGEANVETIRELLGQREI